jgi:hypothetical protein
VEGSCDGAGGCWNSGSDFVVAIVAALVDSDGVAVAVEVNLAGMFVAVVVFEVTEATSVAVTVVAVDELEFPTIVDSDNVEAGWLGLVRLVGFFMSESEGRLGDENEKAFRLLLRLPGRELEFSRIFLLPAGPGLVAFGRAVKEKNKYNYKNRWPVSIENWNCSNK